MVITDKYEVGTTRLLLLEQLTDVGDDAARRLAAVEGVALLQKASYHVRD
jgi:hypothetical protein